MAFLHAKGDASSPNFGGQRWFLSVTLIPLTVSFDTSPMARSLSSLLPAAFRPAAAPDRPEKYVKTISVSAEDVTDEVKAELADLSPEEESSAPAKS